MTVRQGKGCTVEKVPNLHSLQLHVVACATLTRCLHPNNIHRLGRLDQAFVCAKKHGLAQIFCRMFHVPCEDAGMATGPEENCKHTTQTLDAARPACPNLTDVRF